MLSCAAWRKARSMLMKEVHGGETKAEDDKRNCKP